MRRQLSPQAQEILEQLQAEGRLGSARDIFRMPAPHPDWWKAISASAKSRSVDPDHVYYVAAKELSRLRQSDPTIPGWPRGMYETENSLPAISQEEALAILGRFLIAEKGSMTPGTFLYLLQWDVLAAQYRPLRERYDALRTLVESGLLVQAAGSAQHEESRLRWPLVITERAILEIDTGRLRAKLPAFFSRIERLWEIIRNLVKPDSFLGSILRRWIG